MVSHAKDDSGRRIFREGRSPGGRTFAVGCRWRVVTGAPRAETKRTPRALRRAPRVAAARRGIAHVAQRFVEAVYHGTFWRAGADQRCECPKGKTNPPRPAKWGDRRRPLRY